MVTDELGLRCEVQTDLNYLAKKAGDVEVMVEPIHPTANQYGTDIERVPTTFRDFLTALRVEEGPHPYLTTQYSEDDPDSETVFPPPTNVLREEYPLVPRIMGNLFLQQVNLWLGRSKDGSSSGLVSVNLGYPLDLICCARYKFYGVCGWSVHPHTP